MPLPRFHRLPADKRTRLIDKASREFSEKGFEAASLNEILAETGLGKSSYYYYFADKEDLYATCVATAIERMVGALPPFPLDALDAHHFWDAIESYFHEAITMTRRYPTEMALLRTTPAMRARLLPRFQEAAQRMLEPVTAAIRKGQALGHVRKDIPAETLFRVGMAADNALDEAFLVRPISLEGHSSLVLDMWRRILAPAPSPARRPPRRPRRPSR